MAAEEETVINGCLSNELKRANARIDELEAELAALRSIHSNEVAQLKEKIDLLVSSKKHHE